MKITKNLILTLLVTSMSGCSTTGGTVGGLFPAPKFLKGEVEQNIYISKDSDFEVQIPHKEGTYEYTYMEVKEQYSNLGAYISFGPAAFDQSIYRLEIGKKLSPESKQMNFEEATNALVENYIKQLETGYEATVYLSEKKKTLVNGAMSYYILLDQPTKENHFEHKIYITDYETMAVVTSVQEPLDNESRATISALEFARSFKISP